MESAPRENMNSEVRVSFYKKLCRKKWFKVLRPILIVTLFVGVVYLLTVLGFFKVKDIEVSNELRYVGGFREVKSEYLGVGYFLLDLNEFESDVRDSDLYIKEVYAQKVFPNKIRMTVEEYTPNSYIEYKGVCYVFSEEGVILEKEQEYDECVFEGYIELRANQNIIKEDGLIFDREIFEISKLLEEFGWEIQEIFLEKSVLHILDGQREIVLEIDSEYEVQLSKLYLVLEKANMEEIEYVLLDLRFDKPVMKIP